MGSTEVTGISGLSHRKIVAAVGVGTFFFGFAAGAIANVVLLRMGSPLVLEHRSTLTYASAIVGDGAVLPIVNMLAASFLLRSRDAVGRGSVLVGVALGLAVTLWFHIGQAMNGPTNWVMPEPWHWNILGLWHAVYMLAVASLLCTFAAVAVNRVVVERRAPWDAAPVAAGVVLFFVTLRMDGVFPDFGAWLFG